MPLDLDAASVSRTEDGALRVEWHPEDHVSVYDSCWLRRHRNGANGDAQGPKPVTWDAELSDAMPTVDHAEITGGGDGLLRWLHYLRDSGVAILRGTPREPLSVLAARAAHRHRAADQVLASISTWSRSRSPTAMPIRPLGLPCHTDLPNWELPPGYQFLHCLENDAEGGDSILVDGFRAAKTLRQREPEAFRLLCRSPIDFLFQDRESDIRFRAPIIALDEGGAVEEVRFNLAVMDAIRAPAHRMGALCRAFRAFAAVVRDPALECRYRLRPGELLIFDNRRVLHGRAAFDLTTGWRHLQGCYVDRDQVLSCIRVLECSAPPPAMTAARLN